jgi:hypothetical protein
MDVYESGSDKEPGGIENLASAGTVNVLLDGHHMAIGNSNVASRTEILSWVDNSPAAN